MVRYAPLLHGLPDWWLCVSNAWYCGYPCAFAPSVNYVDMVQIVSLAALGRVLAKLNIEEVSPLDYFCALCGRHTTYTVPHHAEKLGMWSEGPISVAFRDVLCSMQYVFGLVHRASRFTFIISAVMATGPISIFTVKPFLYAANIYMVANGHIDKHENFVLRTHVNENGWKYITIHLLLIRYRSDIKFGCEEFHSSSKIEEVSNEHCLTLCSASYDSIITFERI